MKPTTVVALALMVPAMLGYLYYGWLLLQTLSSEKGLLASFTFTNLFILWLLPLIIGLILLTLKIVNRKQH